MTPSGPDGSIIARHVDGVCVWGQAFRFSPYDEHGRPDPDQHARSVAAIVDRVSADPDAYHQWWLR